MSPPHLGPAGRPSPWPEYLPPWPPWPPWPPPLVGDGVGGCEPLPPWGAEDDAGGLSEEEAGGMSEEVAGLSEEEAGGSEDDGGAEDEDGGTEEDEAGGVPPRYQFSGASPKHSPTVTAGAEC